MATVTQLPSKIEGKPHFKMNVIGGNRAYEGASTAYRMQTKGLQGGSANTALNGNLRNLRARARHAVRNNPYAASAIETYTSNLIGKGIRAKWANQDLQKAWNQWIVDCDADGDESFYGLQHLVARGQFEAGEALCRLVTPRRWRGVPLKLQVFESDHLDESYSMATPDGMVRMGVGFDQNGVKRWYHLWSQHPEEMQFGAGNQRLAVPCNDVLHLFRKLRAGQVRGVPELAPVLIRLYEIDEMQDATLVRQKTAALFGWIIRKRDVGELTMGMPQASTPDGTALTKITPGGIHYLEDDEDVTFSQPADIAGIYVEYLKSELRAVASGIGVTYEQLTGDLSSVNFSSIRAGLLEFRRRLEFVQLTLIVHKFCRPVAEAWLRRAVVFGLAPADVNLDNYLDFLPDWRPPKFEWVDPLKEAQADLLEVRAGFATLAEKQLERGTDPDEVLAQLSREQALPLVLDSNPAAVAKNGSTQSGEVVQGDVPN